MTFTWSTPAFALSSPVLHCNTPSVLGSPHGRVGISACPVILRPVSPLRRRSAHGIHMTTARPHVSAEEELPLAYRTVPLADRPLCVLVGVELTTTRAVDGASPHRLFSLDYSLAELEQLADTAGLSVVGTVSQTLPTPHPSTFIRSGKVSELRSTLHANDATIALFDADLSPGQQRALEEALSQNCAPIQVLDRTAVILDIFAQHAATREGQLQVELALYQYRLPRLTRLWTHLERQSGAGGVGLRGPGETQLEVDRRLIGERVSRLKQDLVQVRAHRARQRLARRRKVGLPVVALIGYTNAGKSTLLNALTGASALEANALFATLDPTTRRAQLDGLKMSPEVLVTDTVGFVQNLPTLLVAAFRATLEEVTEADVLVHVVDGGVDEEVMQWQIGAVENVLGEIGAKDKAMVMVVNKIDVVGAERGEEVRQQVEKWCGCDTVAVSAKDGRGLDEVGVLVDEVLRETMFQVEVVIPYERGDLCGMIYRQGSVLAEEFVEEGTRMTARVPGDLWRRLREVMVIEGEGEGEVFGGGLVMERCEEEDKWAALAKKRHGGKGV